MKTKYYISLFIILTILGCRIQRSEAPLSKIDFKTDEWLLIYIERIYPDTGNVIDNVWMLEDNMLIDSLKREFKCAPNMQSDGPQEYILYMFKNGIFFDWLIYNNKKHFTLGSLTKKMSPVSAHSLECKDSLIASLKIASLNKLYIKNICSPNLDQKYKYIFSLKLPFSNVNDTTFKNDRTKVSWGRDYPSKAKKELLKLYPELNEDQVFVDGAGSYYQADIHCHKNFNFDESKLKKNTIIKYYEIIGHKEKPYIIEYFIKK